VQNGMPVSAQNVWFFFNNFAVFCTLYLPFKHPYATQKSS